MAAEQKYTKEGFKNCWIRPNFKNNIKVYLLAYFGPGILTVFGAFIYFFTSLIKSAFALNMLYNFLISYSTRGSRALL